MARVVYRSILSSVFLLCAACIGAEHELEDESLNTATSAVYAATVTASPGLVELGQNVTASWTAPAEHSVYDWVAMYKVGAADSAYLTYKYVGAANQTSGDLVFLLPLTPALDPGPYEFRYFSGGVKLATSNSFTGYADYELTGTPGQVELGQTAQVTWHAPLAHSPYDYVTLAKVGTPDSSYITYQYVGNVGVASGTLTFTVPLTAQVDPGPYEFRYFFSVKRASSASIAGIAIYQLTDTPGAVELGQTAQVTWHAPLAHSPYDYVTLAKVGTPDSSYITYQYVGNAGVASGTLTFTVPLTQALDPGPYEFRYFFSGKRATSASFTGYADYTIVPGGCVTGQPFAVSWTAPLAHSPYDLTAMYTASGALVTYQYNGGAGSRSGSVNLTGAAPGAYEVRYLFGSRVTATAAVTCTN